jgi:hypothetical protein
VAFGIGVAVTSVQLGRLFEAEMMPSAENSPKVI